MHSRLAVHSRKAAFTLRSPYRYALKPRYLTCRGFATTSCKPQPARSRSKPDSSRSTSNSRAAPTQAHEHRKFTAEIKPGARKSRESRKPKAEAAVGVGPFVFHSAYRLTHDWVPLLEPPHNRTEAEQEPSVAAVERIVQDDRTKMSSSIEILTTPTSDTPGTTLVLRTAIKHYVFGSQAEGTQRALVQQGARLLKAQDFFLTGKAEWKNTGGFMGMMLTLADASSSSYEQAMLMVQQARDKGRTAPEPAKHSFNIYGPPNLKHTMGTCRRFIFRKGLPINVTEYADRPVVKDDNGGIPPTWQDANIQVWALPVSPVRQQQDPEGEAELEALRQDFDARLNTFEDHRAPQNESKEDRDARYDRIRSATLKFMFNSNWSFDTLLERHISEVQMPAAIFVRNPDTHGYEPYQGPRPGGSEPLPDTTVWTRTPWPGATIMAIPPTQPLPECLSYIVRTFPSRGTFDVARAKALGVKPGPDFGKLTAGKSVQNENGDWIEPSQVLGADRPGQGIAILEVPSLEYLEAIVQREELNNSQVMAGICAILWVLGPNISGHSLLSEYMAKLSNVQHIISSADVSPNRIAHDSVACQATRLSQVDPARYSVPIHDNSTVPQASLFSNSQHHDSSMPKGSIRADRGLSFTLMPKFTTKEETKTQMFENGSIERETDAEVLRLAAEAQQAVKDDQVNQEAWKQLLARPDTEVITLGTGSALPSKYRNVSATLIRVPGVGNYLLDCGENTLGQLSRVFAPEELRDIIKNLRVIWISHLHADHHLGTTGVIRAWYHLVHSGVPNKDKPSAATVLSNSSQYGLSVISHAGMLQWLYEYSSVEDFGYSRILPLEVSPNHAGHGSLLNILNSFNTEQDFDTTIKRHQYSQLFGFDDIQTANVVHCHGAMAVSITFPRSSKDPRNVKPLKVSYSGDCRPSRHFAKVGCDTTVLIHEATFDDELLGDAKAKKHSTTSEALDIGSKMNAKAVVLTHFSQRYQKIPVLETVTEGEQEDPLPSHENTVEEDSKENDAEVESTLENPDNMDIQPTTQPSSTATPKVAALERHASSTVPELGRVIKVRNPDMKVAIAFDYMRVKIGDIAQLEKFNQALSELLVKEEEVEGEAADAEGGKINSNGKKTSGDEGGGGRKKQKQSQGTPKMQKTKSQRNN